MLTVYVRDENNEKIGELDLAQADGLTLVLRYNDIGTWTLVVNAKSEQAALVGRKRGIYVVNDGQAIFSGYVTGFERVLADDGAETLTLYGQDDLGLIASRLAYPDPSGPPYTAQEYDTRAGIAETVIKEYVRYNAADLAQPARRIVGLTVEDDYVRGGAVVGRARFDNLLELVQSLAYIGGVGVRCVDMQFAVYAPADMSGDVVLSPELGTVLGYTYEEARPESSYIICGGLGEGTARTFVETQNAEAITTWGRVEGFVDYARTSVMAELLAQALAELDKASDTAKLTVTLPPEETEGRRPLVDYSLGDVVSCVLDGEVVKLRLVQVEITTDTTGAVQVSPTLAAGYIPIGLLNPAARTRSLRRSLNNLERR